MSIARNLAEQAHVLRLVYSAKLEDIFEKDVWLTVVSETGGRKELRTLELLLDFIYTRNANVSLRLILHQKGRFIEIQDIKIFWDILLIAIKKCFLKESFSLLNRQRFLQELSDSLENETLSFYARLYTESALRSSNRNERNFWKWIAQNPRSQAWFQDNNHDIDSLLLQIGSFSGHRAHPSTKMKLKIDPEDPSIRVSFDIDSIKRYSPEFAPDVPIQIAAIKVKRSKIKISMLGAGGDQVIEEDKIDTAENYVSFFKDAFPKAYSLWKASLVDQIGRDKADEYVPVCIHPLQLPEIKHRFSLDIACQDIILLSNVIINQRPTLSLRTLSPVGRKNEPQIKTSINMQMTSVVRTLAPARTFNAPVFSDTLSSIVSKDAKLNTVLRISREPAAVYWGTNYDPGSKDYRDGYHLGTIFKENPALLINDDEIRMPVNTLFSTSPFSGERILTDIMRSAGVETRDECREFFKEYANIVIKSDLGIFVRYGISLESHQQNTDMVFNFSGKPKATVYRDINGGLEIFEPILRLNGYDIRSKIHPNKKGLLDTINLPLQQTMHTTFLSHIFPLISVISKAYNVPKKEFFSVIQTQIKDQINEAKHDYFPLLIGGLPSNHKYSAERLFTQTLDYIEKELFGKYIEIKSLMTMRINQSQEVIFRNINNPLKI